MSEILNLVDALVQEAAVDTRPLTAGQVSERALPPGWTLHQHDCEVLLDHPRRARGEIKVRSAKGFIDAVTQRWPVGAPVPGDIVQAEIAEGQLIADAPVAIYADDATQTLVAILNDDWRSTAGWRDLRVVLDVRKTEEWVHWTASSGKLLEQSAFATVIEDGYLEIKTPSPAVMLRIAESFEATVGVTFKKGSAVRDGAQQYVYEEKIDASAAGGSIEIPESFSIAVAPFIGSPKYEVKAALKTRLVSGKFSIGYTLERPHEVERWAFRDIASEVAAQLELTAIEGVAPQAR